MSGHVQLQVKLALGIVIVYTNRDISMVTKSLPSDCIAIFIVKLFVVKSLPSSFGHISTIIFYNSITKPIKCFMNIK